MSRLTVCILLLSVALAVNAEDEDEIIKGHPNCRPSTGITYFPHKSDCKSYYSCIGVDAHKQTCPDEFEYNAEKQLCDYQTLAGCSIILDYDECQLGVESWVADHHDCRAYYACQKDGTAFKFFCPEGLEYNQEKRLCDHPEVAKCTYIENYPGCQKGKESFVPHPKDCSAYYYCLVEGDAARHNCPDGYLFNKVKQVCEYPEKVTC